MPEKKPVRTISSGAEQPAQLYFFVEVASFTEDWGNLKFGDDELRSLEDEIARNPTRAPVVPDAGGATKVRRGDPFSGKGKRGGYRVLYAFLPVHGTILLIAAWPKSEREDLQRDDYKAIGGLITQIEKQFDQRRNS